MGPTSPQTVPPVEVIFCQLTLFMCAWCELSEGGGGGGRGIPPAGVGGGGGTAPGVLETVMSLVGVAGGVA